tara:strand:- start:1421 stop:2239 length:819 start_codon:yes stop_codon:yes gene_type:complete
MTIKINGNNLNTAPGTAGSDDDSGIVYGSDQVKVVTGGLDRLVVDNNGLNSVDVTSINSVIYPVSSPPGVGIGTNAPSSLFDVNGVLSVSHVGSSRSWNIQCDGVDGRLKIQDSAPSINEHVAFPLSGGITFNGDTADANALDDYEEGTWTPTVSGGTMNSSTYAKYIKIGNKVHLYFYFKIGTIDNSTGTCTFGGCPFLPADGGYTGSCMVNNVGFNSSANTTLVPYISSGTNGVRLYGFRHNAAWQSTRRVDWNANDSCYGQVSFCHLDI